MADGALLGIKSIGRNAEHIIALDADAVDDRANDGAGLDGFVAATRRRSGGFLWDVLSRHEVILARRGLASLESQRHPWDVPSASPYLWERLDPESRSNTNKASNEYGESRAALDRMKCFGPSGQGSSKPRTSKTTAAPEGCVLVAFGVRDRAE